MDPAGHYSSAVVRKTQVARAREGAAILLHSQFILLHFAEAGHNALYVSCQTKSHSNCLEKNLKALF